LGKKLKVTKGIANKAGFFHDLLQDGKAKTAIFEIESGKAKASIELETNLGAATAAGFTAVSVGAGEYIKHKVQPIADKMKLPDTPRE
jgi:hypothetical protein